MKSYLLGVDLGTSGCKTVLFDSDLKVVCYSQSTYTTDFPQKDWAEHKADNWWNAFQKSVKEVLEKSKINSGDIAGIGIDSMSTTVLPVDSSCNPLMPAMIWMDRRADKQADWLKKNLNSIIFDINGNHIDPSFMAAKVLWLKENRPEIYNASHSFLHANGYLVHKLTGNFSMDVSQAGLSQLCDTKKGSWSDIIVKECGIDQNKLPPIYNCPDVVGKITKEAASLTGLKEGTPVIAGAMDNVAAALGAGLSMNGEVYISAGTVTNAGVCIDRPIFKEEMHIYHHILPGLWLTVGGVDFGGAGLKWFRDLLEEKDYQQITKLADASVYNSNPLLFLPYMVGQRAPLWNHDTRGVIFGLNPETNRQDLVRMFMEGTAYGTRKIFEIVEKEHINIGRVKMTGGCTNIDAWVQSFADITTRAIDVPGEMDVAPLGAAMAAGLGGGLVKDIQELVKKIPAKGSYQPNKSRSSYYNDMFRLFSHLYESVQKEYAMLSEITNKYK